MFKNAPARVFWMMSVGFLSGCAYVNPFIRELNIVPIAQEIRVGEQMQVEIAKEMTLVSDPAVTRRVSAIGERLVEALPRKDFDYRFFVVDESTPNAFTIPGAAIYVHTGLLKFVDDDDELAGVIGHEIGHAYKRHPAKGLSRAYGVEFLSQILFKKNSGQLKALTLKLAKTGILTKYGRDDEREADDIGYYLARRAGYDGNGLLRFLKKLETLTAGRTTISFLSTHPPTPERIARLEARARRTASIEAGEPAGARL